MATKSTPDDQAAKTAARIERVKTKIATIEWQIAQRMSRRANLEDELADLLLAQQNEKQP